MCDSAPLTVAASLELFVCCVGRGGQVAIKLHSNLSPITAWAPVSGDMLSRVFCSKLSDDLQHKDAVEIKQSLFIIYFPPPHITYMATSTIAYDE